MNREQVVEAVANLEREFNAMSGSSMSDDSLVVMYRRLGTLALHVAKLNLPATKIDQLDEAIVGAMSEDARERAFDEVRKLGLNEAAKAAPNAIQSQSGTEFLEELHRKSGGQPIQVISNPVNPDGSLTPEMQAHLDAQGIDLDELDEEIFNEPQSEDHGPPKPPPPPPKSEDERRKEVTDLFGDLSL